MKNIILIVVPIVIVISVIVAFNIKKDSRKTNDAAEKDTDGRYLTIINDTEQIINDVYVTVGNGTEIEKMRQKNPDEKSFSIEIPKDYSEYNTFTVTLIDRYDMKYEKVVNDVKAKGRTEVKINKENYVKEKGDFLNGVDKFFNGD